VKLPVVERIHPQSTGNKFATVWRTRVQATQHNDSPVTLDLIHYIQRILEV